ncbi:MAG: carbohydrate-binding domain-containing protein [Sodaliphilus sp.]
MKKILLLLATIALLTVAPSCESDDTDFSQIIADNDTVSIRDIQFNDAEVTDSAEQIPTDIADEYYDDYIENQALNRVANITFNGEEATVSGDLTRCSIIRNGAHLTVRIGGKKVYLKVSGSTSNGSIKIYGENKFGLELCGASIHNPHGAAINCQNKKRMYVVLADGSQNVISDGADYIDTEGEAQKATIFSEGKIIVSGKGVLQVDAQARAGIASDDYVRLRPGVHTRIISHGTHCIRANDGVMIDGGVHNLETYGAGARGIRCEAFVKVNSGRTTVITHGGSVIEEGDTTSAAAVKADSILMVSGGELRLKSTGDGGKGINAADFMQTGGSVSVVTLGETGLSSPKGVKSDSRIAIEGGTFYSYSVHSYAIEGTLVLKPGAKKHLTAKRYHIVEY